MSTSLVVVPNEFANLPVSANLIPFGMNNAGGCRYQEVFDKSHFANKGTITALSFRLYSSSSAIINANYSIKVNLAYSANAPGSLSTTFASNIGSNNTTCLDNTSLVMNASTGNPAPFDFTLNFTSNFSYDPAVGHLLIDILVRTQIQTDGFDQASYNDFVNRPVQRMYTPFGGSYNDSTGNVDGNAAGLIAQFTMTVGDNIPVTPVKAGNFLLANGVPMLIKA